MFFHYLTDIVFGKTYTKFKESLKLNGVVYDM